MRNKISGRKILSSKVYDHKLVNIKNVRRRVFMVERNSKMVNILLDDRNFISVHLLMMGRFLWRENATKPKTWSLENDF